MAESGFITGQYVHIKLTPASVGERILAQIIDWIVRIAYTSAIVALFSSISSTAWYAGMEELAILLFAVLPCLFYTPLCELFNRGQTIGKQLLKMRVVKTDGSTPGLGAWLLRWLLFLVDGPMLSGLGVLVMLLNERRQRLGDLAAGTMVIKLNSYARIQVSLDEFDHLSRNYRPVYPQAQDLSLEQVNLISKTFELPDDDPRVHALARKVQEVLHIDTPQERADSTFLWRIIRDYQYYALEEI